MPTTHTATRPLSLRFLLTLVLGLAYGCGSDGPGVTEPDPIDPAPRGVPGGDPRRRGQLRDRPGPDRGERARGVRDHERHHPVLLHASARLPDPGLQ